MPILCLTWLFGLLPILVLFSGMAMTPFLILTALVVVVANPSRGQRNTYTQTLTPSVAALVAAPLLIALGLSFWSVTPDYSANITLLVLLLCVAGGAGLSNVALLPSPTPRLLNYYGMCLAGAAVLLIANRLLPIGPIDFIYQHLGLDYERFMAKNVNRGLCALSVLVWPWMLGMAQNGYQKRSLFILAILSVAVGLMHSLSAKMGLLTGSVLFFGLLRYPSFFTRALGISIPLFLLCFPVIEMLSEHWLLTNEFTSTHLPASSIHRLKIWHVLRELWYQHPWFGFGVGATRAAPLSADALAYITLAAPPLHPHNPSMQLLLETGIVGFSITLVSLTLLLKKWVRHAFASPLHRATSGALIAAYVAAGMSSFGIWQVWWIATLWIGFIFWQWQARS